MASYKGVTIMKLLLLLLAIVALTAYGTQAAVRRVVRK